MAEDKFSVSFKGKALQQLRDLASKLDIPHDQLGELILKGIKIIELAKGDKLVMEVGNEKLEIDLKKL